MARFAGADAWIEQYFLNSPDDEREEFTSAELEDLARTHRALAEIRAPKTSVVAARNDDYNTTLYVATDDMPHIVSSLTAYLSAHFGGFLGQRRHRRRRYALPAAFRGRSRGVHGHH